MAGLACLARGMRPALRRPLRAATRQATRSLSATTWLASPAASPAPARDAPAAPAALELLERSIAQKQSARALDYLAQLETPPTTTVLQKLAVLLARQKKSRDYSLRAFEILRDVYHLPGLQPDDYTKLASIYVMDACLRYRMLDQAVELYEEALNQNVSLDLPAYDALLNHLLEGNRLEEATEILREVVALEDVSLQESSFLPVLVGLLNQREYGEAIELMRLGSEHGVVFTGDTFYVLVEIAESDTQSTESLVSFLNYVDDFWEDAKTLKTLEEMNEWDDDDDDDTEGPKTPERS